MEEIGPRPELSRARGDILIKDVLLSGKTVDMYIDEGGRIAAIGEGVGRNHRNESTRVIEGRDRVAAPGFVNTHTHAAMTLLRGYADDMPLQKWLTEEIWPLEAHLTGDDVYRGTKLACLEMIRSGTTAFNDQYFFMEHAARATAEMGIRGTFAHGFLDFGVPEKREAGIKATESLVAHIRSMDNPCIRASVGPHSVYTVSVEGLSWCSEFAEEQGIGIHIHLSETEQEVVDSILQYGKRPPQVLDECGCLTPMTVAAHCCWLDEADCALLGRRGVHAAHNPASNMKLAVNRAMPYHWLKKSGANISLGTDGCASNNNLDMLEEMKFAALLQKFSWNDQTLLPAGEALEIATAGGARALGIGTGRLEVGAPADLILLDRHAVCNVPLYNPDSNIVYACNGDTVKTVICDGRVVMLDRVVPGEEEIRRGAALSAEALLQRRGDRE